MFSLYRSTSLVLPFQKLNKTQKNYEYDRGSIYKGKITSQSKTGHHRREDKFIDSVEKGDAHTRALTDTATALYS